MEPNHTKDRQWQGQGAPKPVIIGCTPEIYALAGEDRRRLVHSKNPHSRFHADL